MKFNLPKKIKFGFWTISAVILGVFLASLIFNNNPKEISYKKATAVAPQENIATVLESITPGETTSESSYFIKNPSLKPQVEGLAYLVGDLDTGEVILEKNQDEQFPIASVSKLMTATIASSLMNPNDVAKVSKQALTTYGQNGDLKLGEKIKISDLIYPLLLESSNRAAEVIAEYFNRDTFMKLMNQTAAKLEMSKTAYKDPSGLSPDNKSTVSDLFKLTGYINQNYPNLFKITTERSYSSKKYNWFNISQFLSEKNYLGGKSGFTDPAQQTVVSLFSVPLGKTGVRNIAITLLQSKDRYKDVENILKYLNNNIYYGGEADANTAWVKERTDLPPVYNQDFVNLTFGGDIMLDRGVKNSVNKNFGGDYSALFENMGILKKSDIAFANLEGPASDVGKDMQNLYSFRMDPSVVPALAGAGFSILSVANNHVGDWGISAFSDTLSNLKENEISYTGGGQNEAEAEQPVIIEKYGIKIGYLGFSDVGPNWMGATANQAGILLANNPHFDEIIQNASKEVDYLVVSFHFGVEYQTTHNARQEYLAHKAIDDGAKIVIGTHPHVMEDTEVYKNGFIAYSLGNLIFDQSFSKDTMQGMLLGIKLGRDGSMAVTKNIVELNSFFQPEKVIAGKEENIVFKK
jgi:poly-gamma-glutamate synthesis protein (capsule biosynthesis protein)